MPDFLKGKRQLSCTEANRTHCATKVQGIIEVVILINEFSSYSMLELRFIFDSQWKIKQWRYFNQIIQNSNILFVSSYLNIVCGLINAYKETTIIDKTTE